MSQLNQGYLVDVFSHADIGIFENDGVEGDLKSTDSESELQEDESEGQYPEAVEEDRKKWSRKKITIVTGIAVGSAALTGAVVTVCIKNFRPKRAV